MGGKEGETEGATEAEVKQNWIKKKKKHQRHNNGMLYKEIVVKMITFGSHPYC